MNKHGSAVMIGKKEPVAKVEEDAEGAVVCGVGTAATVERNGAVIVEGVVENNSSADNNNSDGLSDDSLR